jgi:type II secretory pathway component GspD/PulD (secretin)
VGQASLEQKISLDFKDTDIRQVFKVISQQIGMGIVCQKSIRGQITLKLQDVKATDALDMVAQSSGFIWFSKGNNIMVTYEKMLPVETRVVELKNVSADLATKILLISIKKDIKVASCEENGKIVLSATKPVLDVANEIIADIDKPQEVLKGRIKVVQGKKNLHELSFVGKAGSKIKLQEKLMNKSEDGTFTGTSVDSIIQIFNPSSRGQYLVKVQIMFNNLNQGQETERAFESEFNTIKGKSVEIVKSNEPESIRVTLSLE